MREGCHPSLPIHPPPSRTPSLAWWGGDVPVDLRTSFKHLAGGGSRDRFHNHVYPSPFDSRQFRPGHLHRPPCHWSARIVLVLQLGRIIEAASAHSRIGNNGWGQRNVTASRCSWRCPGGGRTKRSRWWGSRRGGNGNGTRSTDVPHQERDSGTFPELFHDNPPLRKSPGPNR